MERYKFFSVEDREFGLKDSFKKLKDKFKKSYSCLLVTVVGKSSGLGIKTYRFAVKFISDNNSNLELEKRKAADKAIDIFEDYYVGVPTVHVKLLTASSENKLTKKATDHVMSIFKQYKNDRNIVVDNHFRKI
jgi:hypothetical protein